jgi:hypothetical protein
MFHVPIAPDGDRVGMLDEQQMIHAKPLLALRRDLRLDPERLAITHAPEVFDYALTH